MLLAQPGEGVNPRDGAAVASLLTCETTECAYSAAADMTPDSAGQALDALLRTVDPDATSDTGGALCHTLSHPVGERLGSTGDIALVTQRVGALDWTTRLDPTDPFLCQAGILHGALTALGTTLDPATVSETASTICNSVPGWPAQGLGYLRAPDTDQPTVACAHGVGHLLFSSYRTTIPLDSMLDLGWEHCAALPTPATARNCLSGLVMAQQETGAETDPTWCATLPTDAAAFCTYTALSTVGNCLKLPEKLHPACLDGAAVRHSSPRVAETPANISAVC